MFIQRLSVVALTALTLACGEDRPRLRVAVEGSSFTRQLVPSTSMSPVAYVPYTVTNDGNRTAFLPTCGSRVTPVVEQLVNGHWEAYASGFCILASSPMVPLEPGAAQVRGAAPVRLSVVMIRLELREGQSHDDQVAIGDAGRFRIRMPYSADAQGSKQFDAVSWQFDVH